MYIVQCEVYPVIYLVKKYLKYVYIVKNSKTIKIIWMINKMYKYYH